MEEGAASVGAHLTHKRFPPRMDFDQWCDDTIKEGGGIYLQGEVPTTPALPPCEVVRT